VPMFMLDLMVDQRVLESSPLNLPTMLEMLSNNSTDTIGKDAHLRFVRIVLQALAQASEVEVVSVLVELSVVAVALGLVEDLGVRLLVAEAILVLAIREVQRPALKVELEPLLLFPTLSRTTLLQVLTEVRLSTFAM
jgi:hypothetical protein